MSEHGSDICQCGDFRSEHTDNKLCRVCPCGQFRFAHKASDEDLYVWNKYHAWRKD